MQIHVARSELAEMPVDAVVNPANSQCLMIEGAGALLKAAGGQEIEDEARLSAPVAVGAAVVTKGGDLYAKHVIHAPSSEFPTVKIGVEAVRRATRAALIAAARWNLETIAMPVIGTGTGGVPIDEATRAMVDELRAHKQPKPVTVYLVAAREEILRAFEEALKNAVNPM